MSTKITSNGTQVNLEYDGITETVSSNGTYSAQTGMVSKSNSPQGVQETGTQRNIDIKGNSQENYYTRGVTCEADIKIVGGVEQFDPKYHIKLQRAQAELAGLLVQSGDDRKSVKPSLIPSFDFSKIVKAMTSEFSSKNPPPVPNIKSWYDVVPYLADMAKWKTECVTADVAYKALKAAALEAESQYMQYEENLLSQVNDMIERVENLFESGSPATEDKEREAKPNIDKKTLFQTIPFEYINELEKNI